MASTNGNDSAGKQRTQPMTGNPIPQPTGYDTLRPDQGVAPFAETAPPGLKVPDAAPPANAETRAPGTTPTPPPSDGYAPTMAPLKPGELGPANANGLTGPTVCGYKLGKMLGRGGFGKVYLAEAAGGVPVAVKIVEAPRDSNEAAQRELQALEVIKQLRHPFLLSTHAFHSLENELVIAMELADGSLRDELFKSQRAGQKGLVPERLIPLMAEASEALDYLHDKKMTHRDIKPENILLLAGHAKLADFGLVRVVQENRAQASVSLTGTLAYMAPEVFRGHTHKNSDQYALALTYLELRFGERFVTTNDLVEAMLKHVEHEPDYSRLEPHERTVIKKALAKDPEQRWRSCTEMARALADGFGKTELRGDSAQQEMKQAPKPRVEPKPVKQPLTKPKTKPAKRKTGLFVLAGVGILGAMVVGALLLGKVFKGTQSVETTAPEKTEPEVVSSVILPVVKPWKTVPAPESKVVLEDGKEYHSVIDLILDEKTSIRFILIKNQSGTDPRGLRVPAFYIMQNKVSYQLFDRFSKSDVKLQNDQWQAGAMVGPKPDVNPDWPVMSVTVEDAMLFARWLRGDLPSVEQWKKAAGFYDPRGRDGPYIPMSEGQKAFGKDEIALDRANLGPMCVGTATKDISIYDVRDMAGNGKEWTHTMHNNPGERVPLGRQPGEADLVLQAGNPYENSDPLQFVDIARGFQGASYRMADPQCSFRIVLNLR